MVKLQNTTYLDLSRRNPVLLYYQSIKTLSNVCFCTVLQLFSIACIRQVDPVIQASCKGWVMLPAILSLLCFFPFSIIAIYYAATVRYFVYCATQHYYVNSVSRLCFNIRHPIYKSSQVKSSQVKFIAQQYTFIVWQTHITLRYKDSTDIYT